jgi:hypothetical protein
MDYGVFETMTIEGFAAGTLHQRTRFLRRKLLTSCPHRILSLVPVAAIAPFLKVGLGSLRQKDCPCALEVGAGIFKGG